MRRGFLLGKFLPPHLGHLHLCRTAQALCDELTILVCSLPDDPIPGELRAGWMTELQPRARVLHHDSIVPQEPSEQPDFWAIWRGICREAMPEGADLVFASEIYGTRLAAELGADPVLVDPDRLAFPISGRAILEDPAAHWDMVPGPVRPYYQKRVVLIGAESTGKTTLARQMAEALGTRAVPEYGRGHDLARGVRDWTDEDFAAIRDRQRALRRSVATGAGPVLVEDTDALATDVWQHVLTGTRPVTGPVPDAADLYLLLDTDLPWRDDGTRYLADPAARADFSRICRQRLISAAVDWAPIRGRGAARLDAALAEVRGRFPLSRARP